MDEIIINKLKQILSEIKAINASFRVDGVSTHFIEFIDDDDSNSSIISANTEGFVYLAYRMLVLAVERKEYGHQHFDEYSMLDKNDRNLIIHYKKAPWD